MYFAHPIIKMGIVIQTSDPYFSILQHAHMVAYHLTPVCKIKLCIKGSCLLSALLYMHKINTVYS